MGGGVADRKAEQTALAVLAGWRVWLEGEELRAAHSFLAT